MSKDKIKINDINDTNDIAIDILEKIKNVVLIEFLNLSNEEKQLKYDKIYNSIKDQDTINDKIYSIELWDSNEEYYTNLKKYLYDKIINAYAVEGENIGPKSSFVMKGILSLINFLTIILETKKSAYKNDKIKFDISILVELISGKDETILNNKYFYIQSIEELQNEFNIIYNENNEQEIIRLNKIIEDKALKKLNIMKNSLKNNIAQIFTLSHSKIKSYFSNVKNCKDYTEMETNLNKIKAGRSDFLEYKKKIKNPKDFINKCKNNKEIMNIFNYYSTYLIKANIINLKKDINYIIENLIFQEGIFEIDLNNQENLNIIYDIDCSKYKITEEFRDYEKAFYYQYLKFKKEGEEFKNLKNYEKEIITLINNDDFLNEFFSIINSPTVLYFLNGKRKYTIGDNYETQFIEDNDFCNFPDNDLSQQFSEFMKYINNDYHKLSKLIILKQLGLKIHGAVDSNMRIFINTTLDINKEALYNETKKIELLKAFLKITLLNELFHLLKFFSKKEENEIPKTPKGKENGQMIIFFLFNKAMIKEINYHQSILINKRETWLNKEELKRIFETVEGTEEKYSKEGAINLMITYNLPQNNIKKKIKREDGFCLWEPLF